MARYVGVDLGSTSLEAVLIDTEAKEVVGRASVENRHEITNAEDKEAGYSEWGVGGMAQDAIGLVKELIKKHGAEGIEGIGVAGQQHGMLLVDDAGDAVSPLIGWQDQRCNEERDEGGTTIEQMQSAGGELLADTGCTPATGYMGATLLWLKEHGALPEGLQACFAPDYLAGKLCGESPVTDPTLAASSGLYHVAEDDWHEELVEALDLDMDVLPEVADSCTEAGGLSSEAAGATGLPEGLLVAVSCGDNQASFAGSVAEYGESALVNIGTGGQTSLFVRRYEGTAELDLRPFLMEGYLLVGAGLSGGRAVATLRDFMVRVGEEVHGMKSHHNVYEKLVELAEAVPEGAEGLTCEPTFVGSRREPDLRASWTGMSEANFTPGHMARALLEGMARQYRALYEEMLDSGAGKRDILVGSGNGIRKNALLGELLGECFELPLMTTDYDEAAAVGAALTAAVAAEEFEDIQAASRAFVRHV